VSEGRLPGFDGAAGWLNSPPLTPDDLRGRVVLVDFWTYTCINWLRTLGYVRAWWEKYVDHGLVVIGVHTPEFPFEHDVDNVRAAVEEMNIRYPVALDPASRCGTRSRTATGRRCTSPTRTERSVTTTSARVHTTSAST
jgi:thiol-disulfide isomerase/thioredoxin